MGEIISAINRTLWGVPMLVLLLGCGVYFTIRLRFFQILRIREWMRESVGSLFRERKKNSQGISPYQAMSSALASTIGNGNIVGVATAIVAGGPGAVFWMWISAFFGMATKYAEIYLAVRYRRRRGEEFFGGPMYYIETGLGKGYVWLGYIFAISGAVACIGMGGMNQANSIASAVSGISSVSPVYVGFVLLIVSGVSIRGGIKRISKVTEKLVPLMAIIYIGSGLFIIITNFGSTVAAFAGIFRAALTPKALYGGVSGEMVRRAMRFGIARGVFSNEAGLGSSPIVHAAADTKSPEKQGFWGVFEVFADTIVICSVTAITILSVAEIPEGMTGIELVGFAFSEHMGSIGGVFVAVSTILFALSTILGWSYYGESCVSYLTKGNGYAINVYKILFVAAVAFGANLDVGFVWELSDMFNGIMMIPNLIALFILSDIVIKKK